MKLRLPGWVRLRIIFQANVFNTFVIGLGAVIIGSDEVLDREFDEEIPEEIFPIELSEALRPFLTAYGCIFLAGLLYSISVPRIIAIYSNRGAYLASYDFTGESAENDKATHRAIWNEEDKSLPPLRLAITMLLSAAPIYLSYILLV